jgi:tetratricopeptide (TPR) repeat protein
LDYEEKILESSWFTALRYPAWAEEGLAAVGGFVLLAMLCFFWMMLRSIWHQREDVLFPSSLFLAFDTRRIRKLEEKRAANAGAVSDKTLADCYDSRAHQYLQEKKYSEAAADFSKAIALRGNDSNIETVEWCWFHRAVCYEALGEREKAAEDLKKYLDVHTAAVEKNIEKLLAPPEDEAAPEDPAKSVQKKRKIPWRLIAAAALLTVAVGAFFRPVVADHYNRRGQVYYNAQDAGEADYKQAVKAVSVAIALYPHDRQYSSDYASFYHNRGLVYGTLGEHKKAARDYSRAIKYYYLEANVGDLFNRANEYFQLKDYAAAIDDQEKGISLTSWYNIEAWHYERL